FILSGVGLLGAVLLFPGGITGPLQRLRDAVLLRLAGPPPAEHPSTSTRPHLTRADTQRVPAVDTGTTDTAAPVMAIDCAGITVRYGGHVVLDSVAITAAAGEIVGLVGPNGAGKTTLFDVLSGHL